MVAIVPNREFFRTTSAMGSVVQSWVEQPLAMAPLSRLE